MSDFNNPVTDLGEEVLNISGNILVDEDLKVYRQAICRPNTDLWHSAIEAEMDVLRGNYTQDVVDSPTDRKIVDSKWVFKIKDFFGGSVDQFQG
jgi:hypothetical protein